MPRYGDQRHGNVRAYVRDYDMVDEDFLYEIVREERRDPVSFSSHARRHLKRIAREGRA